MFDDVPPCLSPGQSYAAANPCARALYEWQVNGHGHLHHKWAGWRLAGRDLVSPDGDRISPERLRGILFRESMQARVQRLKAAEAGQRGAKVIPLIPAREPFDGAA